jgi:hypothetical protein
MSTKPKPNGWTEEIGKRQQELERELGEIGLRRIRNNMFKILKDLRDESQSKNS